MRKIFFALVFGMSLFAFSSFSEARSNTVVVAGGWGAGWGRGVAWGGGVYVGYPGYYGYRPVPVYPAAPVPYVLYPAYQPYYGYYPYGPIPVATGGPFFYNNSSVSNSGPFQYYQGR